MYNAYYMYTNAYIYNISFMIYVWHHKTQMPTATSAAPSPFQGAVAAAGLIVALAPAAAIVTAGLYHALAPAAFISTAVLAVPLL